MKKLLSILLWCGIVFGAGAGVVPAWYGLKSFMDWTNSPPEMSPLATRINELLDEEDAWKIDSTFDSPSLGRSIKAKNVTINYLFKPNGPDNPSYKRMGILVDCIGGNTCIMTDKELKYLYRKAYDLSGKLLENAKKAESTKIAESIK